MTAQTDGTVAADRTPGRPVGKRLRVGQALEVRADRLNEDGAGLCSLDGRTIVVPGLLPTERATVIVEHESPCRPLVWAKLRVLQDRAVHRVPPACQPHGPCGGCTLQHLAYAEQLTWKRALLRESLASVLPAGTDCVEAVRAAGEGVAYRSRVKLVVGRHPKTQQLILGAYVPRSHALLSMRDCVVPTPGLVRATQAVARVLGEQPLSVYDERRRTGALRYVLLREAHDEQIQLSLVLAEPLPAPVTSRLVQGLRQYCPTLSGVVLHHNHSTGNVLLPLPGADPEGSGEALGDLAHDELLFGVPHVWDQLGTLALRVSPRSFLQIHRAIAAQIYQQAAALVPAGSHVIDAYAGVGGMGLTVLQQVAGCTLDGLEVSASAIADANASAERAGFSAPQVRFHCRPADDLTDVLGPMPDSPRPEVLLLNPPRRGCTPGILRAIAARKPQRVLYVSCSPPALARDARALLVAGYVLRRCQPYDMHPGTPHIETLAWFDRG